MSLVADSGALYAIYDSDDRHHHAVRECVRVERDAIVVPMAILAEVDYLLRTNLGIQAELDFLASVQRGAFRLEPLTSADVDRCAELLRGYERLDLGLADASVVATAERLGTRRILTVDLRDFRAVVSKRGPFELLPADARAQPAHELSRSRR